MTAPRRPRIGVLAVAVVLAAAAALPVEAQTIDARTVDTFRSRARMRTGWLYLTPSLALDRMGIETNVFRTAEPEQDYVVSLSPRIEAWLPLPRRTVLAVSAIAGVDYYARFAGERSINPDVSALLHVPAGRARGFVGARYHNTRRRPTFELDLRARRVENEARGGVEVTLTPALAVELRGVLERIRFDADTYFLDTRLADVLNRDETAGFATLRWRRNVLSTFTAATEVRRARFVYARERDTNSVVARIGAEFHPRALISGSGEVGVHRFDASGLNMPDYTGLVALANLSFRMDDSTRVTLEIERDVRYSYEWRWPYYVLGHYGLQMRRQLAARYYLTAGAGRQRHAYRVRRDGQGPAGRNDTRWTFSGAFGYRLNADFEAGVEMRYYRWDSSTAAWRRLSGVEAGIVLNYGS